MLLHEAIIQVLKENSNMPMTYKEIATKLNQKKYYTKKDGTVIKPDQIRARIKNYSNLFNVYKESAPNTVKVK